MTSTRQPAQEVHTRPTMLPDSIVAIARTQPDLPALEGHDASLTYGQMLDRASRLGGLLRHRGVGRESLVAICMQRSAGFVTAMFGTMLSGGAYLPLDPGHPTDRLHTIIRESAAAIVLADRANADRFADFDGAPLFVLDDAGWESLAASSPSFASPDPHDLAYVIYTSGSTGTPKGVEIEHGSIAHVVADEVRSMDIRLGDRCLQFAAQGFDALQVEVWPALTKGGAVVVVDEEARLDPKLLRTHMVERGITSAVLPTPMGERLLQLDWPKDSALRNLAVGGEALRSYPREDAPYTFQNEYGPTECTVDSTRAIVPPDSNPSRLPSIGLPLPGVHVHIVGPDGREVPRGESGEMWIAGANVGRGYRHRPDLTAEKFADDPFGCPPGTRLYKSGDVVRWSERGDLEFAGRTDDQVKLRGFRIELGEIALTIARFPEVEQVSVQVKGREEIDRRLVAYIVLAPDAALDRERLDAELGRQLPPYMVPSAYVFLDAMPLTVHGKVDARALPDPDDEANEAPAADQPDAEEAGPLVGMVARIAGQALHGGRLTADDNFFEFGAHSLFAAFLVSRIEEETGIEIAVRDVFEHPTPAGVAGIVEQRILSLGEPSAATAEETVGAYLDRRAAGPTATLGKRPEGSTPVLSPGQEQIWVHEQFMPGMTAYNESSVVRRPGPMDVQALERALDEIARRHEVLRTSYPMVDGGPVPVVHDTSRLTPLQLVDLRHLPREEAEREALRLAREDQAKPFDLARGPLIRARLCRLEDDDYWLLLTIHMMIFDAVSIYDILLREIDVLYEAFAAGRPSPLPEPELQYLDYAYSRRNGLDPQRRERELTYWRRQLDGVPSTLDLPLDHPRPSKELHRGAEQQILIDPALRDELAALAESENTTTFVAVMAAYAALLQRYSGQDDVVIGTPVSTRGASQTEGMIGFFLNTLPVRVNLGNQPSFRQLLRRLRDTMLDGLSHAELPFQDLLKALNLRSGPVSSPLFQAMLVLEPPIPVDSRWTATEMIVGSVIARHDLNLQFEERPEGWVGRMRYDRDLFETDTVAKMVEYLVSLMRTASREPDRALSELALDPDGSIAGRYSMPANPVAIPATAGAIDIPTEGTLAAALEAVARRQPDAPAVEVAGHGVSYRQLDEHANGVAHAILAAVDAKSGRGTTRRRSPGVVIRARVGLLLGQDASMLAGLFGALKAGFAYVPLDPASPTARNADVFADSEAVALVTDAAHLEQARALATGKPIIDVDAAAPSEKRPRRPGEGTGQDSLAYILYTSGSTGKPKGVMQSQRHVLELARAQARAMGIGPSDRMTLVSRYNFDGAAVDIFSGLLSGASLHPIDMDLLREYSLAATLESERVTVYHSVPTVFRLLATEGDADLSSVRLVMLGGEASRASDLDLFRTRFSEQARYVNLHGATEVSVDLHYNADRDTRVDGQGVPIGWPYEGIEPVLLDSYGHPTEVRGELAIRSDAIALGYWHRDDLTAAAFSDGPSGRMYRTGDLAVRRTDGSIEYMGRRDLQVKIHGMRVEIGEIESVLAAHPLVRECAITATTAKDGSTVLAAHVVPAGSKALTASELREYMAGRLLEAMIPNRFRFAESLPKTVTGKTDRRALAAIEVEPAHEAAVDAVNDELVGRLSAIWSAVLGVPVGPRDNFFDLGGHSLLAVRLLDRVERETGSRVPLATLLEDPTVAHQAELIHRGDWDRSGKPIAVQPAGTRPPLFVVPGAGSRILYMHALARHLGPDQPLYVLNEHLRREDGSSYSTVQELAAWYIKSMKSVQPAGPYRLAGYSYGGHVAFEMARQLTTSGEDVALLAIIDTRAPGYPLPAPGFHPSLLPRRIVNQIRILRMLGPRSGLRYLRNRALIARDRLAAGLWEQANTPRTRWLRRFLGPDPIPAGEREWVANDRNAGKSYEAKPYSGRIVFLWPVHNQRPASLYDTREGWDKLARGGLDVRPIAGSHLTVLTEPLVAITARALAKALAESAAAQATEVRPLSQQDRPGSAAERAAR